MHRLVVRLMLVLRVLQMLLVTWIVGLLHIMSLFLGTVFGTLTLQDRPWHCWKTPAKEASRLVVVMVKVL